MGYGEYFENVKGLGVLSTCDDKGNVDAAIYARPHVTEDGLIAFIMCEHLSYENIQKNSKAVYLFKEEGSGYKGKRIYLEKVKESDDQELIKKLERKKYGSSDSKKHLVYFKVTNERPLVGD